MMIQFQLRFGYSQNKSWLNISQEHQGLGKLSHTNQTQTTSNLDTVNLTLMWPSGIRSSEGGVKCQGRSSEGGVETLSL